jgi:NADPH2:quinone reductase
MFRQFGAPSVLELCEVAQPEPRSGEVRIQVHATTVTSAECAMRRGEPWWGRALIGFWRPRRRFRVLGTELAGVVDAVGRGVTRFAVRDRVFGFAGFRIGANAEFICLPESASLALMPADLSFEEAAAAVDGASTALYFVRDLAGLSQGQSLLVVGASGSVGTYAVQLARRLGATVTGVCSTANVELVRSLGAHHVIDYTVEDPTGKQEAYDVVFDTVGKCSFAASKRALKPGGVYLSTVISLAGLLRQLWTRWFGTRRVLNGMSVEKNEALVTIRQLIESGELTIVVDRRYPLERIAEAHRYVDTGRKRGNVVITVA